MKSPENFLPPTAKIETEEKEMRSKSPEVEIAEISDEQPTQHAEVAEDHIDWQASEIFPESEKGTEASAQSMNASADSLDAARQEYGADAQAQEVQNEVNYIAGKVKDAIAAATGESQPEKVGEAKEQTPEELKEEQRMAIVKELEKEWEAKNGPMSRQLSEREIEKNKEMAMRWGEEWDGRITQMTDAAREFFFDYRGMGKNSVPSQAEKIFAERYPEYVKETKKPKEKQEENSSAIPESPPASKTSEQTPRASNSLAKKLLSIFEQAGIESRVVKIENNGEFSEAIIFNKKEAQGEKLVRLYRGINHLDASVLEQIPYAMRTKSGTGKPIALEQVRKEVDALIQNPTYENLTAYAEKVRSNLKPEEVRRLDEDLARIENGILNGHSTRRELVMKQVEHIGGWGDESGISPYISCSFDPHQAVEYGRKGLMVIDVPLSQIEDLRSDSTETSIKGALDTKYITAILPRKYEGTKEKERLNHEIYQALQKVYESAPANLYSNEELRVELEKKIAEETDSDKEQWQKDVEAVRQKRVVKLVKQFPEVKIDSQNPAERGADIYTKAQKDIFDFYKTRLEKIGRNGRNIENYEYSEQDYTAGKKFNKEKPNDIMLLKLRELVLRLEEREEERNGRIKQ